MEVAGECGEPAGDIGRSIRAAARLGMLAYDGGDQFVKQVRFKTIRRQLSEVCGAAGGVVVGGNGQEQVEGGAEHGGEWAGRAACDVPENRLPA